MMLRSNNGITDSPASHTMSVFHENGLTRHPPAGQSTLAQQWTCPHRHGAGLWPSSSSGSSSRFDRSQNVADSLSYFIECREKRPVTVCEKCQQISWNAQWRGKWKSDPYIQDRITTKSWPVLPIGRSNHNIRFQWNQLIMSAVILLTHTHTHTHDDITSTTSLALDRRNYYLLFIIYLSQ